VVPETVDAAVRKNNRNRDYKKIDIETEIGENNRKKSITDIEKNNRHRPSSTVAVDPPHTHLWMIDSLHTGWVLCYQQPNKSQTG
jgi:hypothetical protein